MENTVAARTPKISIRWLWLVLILALFGIAVGLSDHWWPLLGGSFSSTDGSGNPQAEHDDHGDEHDHEHAGHDEANSIELSEQARKNIGLELIEVKLQPYERTITVPGIVVERPGRSTREVTAALTGIVMQIHVLQGEAVKPGQRLFELRLTHEELVQAQGDFLRIAEELDVIRAEVERRRKITEGAIAGKLLLEIQYELQKQEAALHAQEQALLLHGLSKVQVQNILDTRMLLQTLTIYAPGELNAEENGAASLLQVHDLRAEQGQHVEAGATLCSLKNHAELYIEGRAFEQDAQEINAAAAQDWPVAAVIESKGKPQLIEGLKILYVAGRIDAESRALHFYATLPNTLLRETTTDGRKFVYWQYRPGQRMHVRVPVERWQDRIVLPVDGVAQDGAEAYVFQPNGDHFDRRPVHVEYRDQLFAVIANDGSIYPGDTVAGSGAHQLQLAMKNRSGGAADPHAGHSH